MATVEDVRIIELPKCLDTRGNLSFVEQLNHIPFEIKRTYWIYDVTGGEARGGHAFHQNQELLVALSGAFEVVVDDGKQKKSFMLNRSYYGLYVPAGLWRSMENFSTNSLAIEFGSEHYAMDDYIRDYEEYLRWREESSKVQEFKSSRVQELSAEPTAHHETLNPLNVSLSSEDSLGSSEELPDSEERRLFSS